MLATEGNDCLPFLVIVRRARCLTPEISQHPCRRFLVQLPALTDVARTQHVDDLFGAREDCPGVAEVASHRLALDHGRDSFSVVRSGSVASPSCFSASFLITRSARSGRYQPGPQNAPWPFMKVSGKLGQNGAATLSGCRDAVERIQTPPSVLRAAWQASQLSG